MKTTELMLGDWVCVYSNDRTETHPFKVNEIVERGVYDSHKGFIEEKDIEPIPLTSEVFEKSGFEEKILEPKSRLREFYLNDGILIWETANGWVIGSNSDDYHGWFRICYVHELQHELKQFKIEQKINL